MTQDWQSIETAPKDGTKFRARHTQAVYDHEGIAFYDGEKLHCNIGFMLHNKRFSFVPNQWRPLENEVVK